jgi:hypothetical protein
MPTLLSRRGAMLIKVEGTEGTDSVPVAADGVLVEQPVRITFNPNIIDTTEVTPSLDPFDPIVGGTSATIEFDVYIKGQQTAGTDPEWGRCLEACGFARTLQPAVPAVPAALVAGTTTQATLGTGVLATVDLYRGMPIQFTSAQTLNSFIWDYSVARVAKITNTATSALGTTVSYQIPQNLRYVPASASVTSVTIYFYNDGILYKFVGCRAR